MRCKWDSNKNKKLIIDPKRGLGFERIQSLFNLPHYLDQKNDDPEQYRAIGFVGNKLTTLIFEFREDDEGEYYYFVTYWPPTKTERALYEKS